ncbi:uncharacterized protein LOC131841807 [Achroia grisella]|uniref:uncharacterized protein LOC131841807 n=1 Tax=Achroia grisella TaxID=688607 RepID=UPI0027D2B593|nr:uncharacterized protein LOC131841807 [Achroia grisella]
MYMKHVDTDIKHKSMRNMTLYWKYILLMLHELIRDSFQSIAGVTYMDDFDFADRYRDINECNPFYWHPLHLPEACAEMFNKLIRSRVSSMMPLRIMTRKYNTKPVYKYQSVPTYDTEIMDIPFNYENAFTTPYEKMLYLMWKDAVNLPTAPKITSLPFLGPVAFYHQPISKKSKDMVKYIAKAYRYSGIGYNQFPLKLDNCTQLPPKEEHNEKENEHIGQNIKRSGRPKKKYHIKKIIRNGNIVTILKSKHN